MALITIHLQGGPRDGSYTFSKSEALLFAEMNLRTAYGFYRDTQGRIGARATMATPAQIQMYEENGVQAVLNSNLKFCVYEVTANELADSHRYIRATYVADA